MNPQERLLINRLTNSVYAAMQQEFTIDLIMRVKDFSWGDFHFTGRPIQTISEGLSR